MKNERELAHKAAGNRLSEVAHMMLSGATTVQEARDAIAAIVLPELQHGDIDPATGLRMP